MFNEQSGKSGRGVVIQDVNATSAVCMSKIRDLARYPKMVPKVKSVEIYENKKFANVSSSFLS
jgi:membrane protein involved in colicin uptake